MSKDVNIVCIVGNIVADASLEYTSSGFPITKFSIATNRRHKRNDEWVDEASFFNVIQFGKGAESISPYLKKGQKVCCSGELRQERWSAQDGTNRSKVVIDAGYIQLLGGKRESNPSNKPEGEPQFPKFPPAASSRQGGFEDDIPF